MTTHPNAPVVVGVDGSAQAMSAVDVAAEEARLRHRPLRIVHGFAWPDVTVPPFAGPYPGQLREQAAGWLAAARDRAVERYPDLPVTDEIVERAAAPLLIHESAEAALIVLGSRGLGGFTELLAGSIAGQVSAHARGPVIVVRGEVVPDAPVVVGVDGSALSATALGFGFEQAALRHTGLVALHAWAGPIAAEPGDMLPLVYDVDDVAAEETRVLGEALAGWREKYPEVVVTPRVVHQRPIGALTAASAGASMVVVGSRGRGGFAGLLLGSVSHALIHHAQCPVAVVRPVPE